MSINDSYILRMCVCHTSNKDYLIRIQVLLNRVEVNRTYFPLPDITRIFLCVQFCRREPAGQELSRERSAEQWRRCLWRRPVV